MSKKHAIGLFLLTFGIVVIFGLPSHAQDTANILTSAQENMTSNRAWWSSLWELNFNKESGLAGTPSLSDMTFNQITQWFFAGSLVIYLTILFFKLAVLIDLDPKHIFKETYPFILSVIIVTSLMANNNHNLKGILFDIRTTMNSWPAALLDAQIVDQTPRQALTDTLLTDRAQLKIAGYLQSCKPLAPLGTVALPTDVLPSDQAGPMTLAAQQTKAFTDCMKSVAVVAKAEIEKAEVDCGLLAHPDAPGSQDNCKFMKRFSQSVSASIDSITATEQEKLKNGGATSGNGFGFLDFVAGMTANAANRPTLAASQWLWISFLELAMFLTGIGALINVPIALIPGRLNIAVGTLIAFLTLGLANVMYVVTIGVVAMLMSADRSLLFSDMRFPMALGAFAPIVSFMVVAVGGIAAANAFTGASFTAANVVLNAGSSIIGNAGTAISRGGYGRR